MLGLKDLFPNQGPKQNPNAAPYFEAPQQKIVAVEHPFVIRNVDNGIKSFGRDPNFQRVRHRVLLSVFRGPQSIRLLIILLALA
jgi:hypothetical protein